MDTHTDLDEQSKLNNLTVRLLVAPNSGTVFNGPLTSTSGSNI